MKRRITIMIILSIFVIALSAQESKMVEINFYHSKRIPYNHIFIVLYQQDDNRSAIAVQTEPMENSSGFEESDKEYSIPIESEDFDELYNKLLGLDFPSIIENNKTTGYDGNIITILIGDYQNNLSLRLWSPDYETEERGLLEIYLLIQEIFGKVGLLEWL